MTWTTGLAMALSLIALALSGLTIYWGEQARRLNRKTAARLAERSQRVTIYTGPVHKTTLAVLADEARRRKAQP